MALSTTSLILLLFPAFAFFRLAGISRERFANWQWLCLRNSLAAIVALGIVRAAIDNLETMANVRWKRVLIRGLLMLAAGFNAVTIFIVLDFGNSSAAARSACAVVAVAAQLPVVWIFFLG